MQFDIDMYNNINARKGIDKAIEYRNRCFGKTEEEVQENKELSRDEMKEKLQEAGIEFFNNIKTDKLKELCIENNLI